MDITMIQQYAVQFLGDYWGPVCVVLLCGLCAIISAFMPAPTETSTALYRYIYNTINVIGLNVFKAKNADEVVVKAPQTQATQTEQKTEETVTEEKK